MIAKKNTILIIDDEEIARAILVEGFEKDYEIIEASNGKEGLQLLEKYNQKILVVILDLIMPELDGYDVLKQIMQNPSWNQIPVVISTSETSEESDIRLISLGAKTILHKPYNLSVILLQVQNIIQGYNDYLKEQKEMHIQKYLISQRNNLFFCTYYVGSGMVRIDSEYDKVISEDFIRVFDEYPFRFDHICLPFDKERLETIFDYRAEEDNCREVLLRLKKKQNVYEWYRITVFFHVDIYSTLYSIDLLINNVNDEIEAKEYLEFIANSDILTHIPNVRVFQSKLSNMLMENVYEKFAMIVFDISNFRMINTLYGNKEGDKVLTFLATKLQERIESYDKGVYCRMSSDIFYACIENKNDMVQELIQYLQEKMKSYPISFDIHLYFGVYFIKDAYEDAGKIINHAIYARNLAKKRFYKSVVYFDDEIREKEYFENTVVSEMEYALENHQFEVFLQGKRDLNTDSIYGAEALIRWNHPEKGYFSPGVFIPIFEKNGFITYVDLFVIKEVARQLREWINQGIEPVPISVNISRADLYNPFLLEKIKDIIEKYDVPSKYIEFEITESAFASDNTKIKEFTEGIQKIGCKTLVDDFGSGYSSLNSLKNMCVDILKLDIKFLPLKKEDKKAKIILESIIEMAKKLELGIIAEGVETKEQSELLKELGCNIIQGFYFYKPIPVQEFEKMIVEEHENKRNGE